jgi:hypothetical protein|tara:strand:+ start:216 stop:728 length:513 start_codon:yes stop_codon:yes gene_type:complete
MLKGLQSGFSKFFTNQRVLILVIFLLLCFVLTSYANSKGGYAAYEGYEEPASEEVMDGDDMDGDVEDPRDEGMKNEGFNNMGAAASVNKPSDLLPTNSNSELVGSFKTEEGQFPGNLLESGAHIGLDTVSSSMRNANLQLRADPSIPKKSGCWWGESTINADPNPIGIKV